MASSSTFKEISYLVYPGNSARWFPEIMTVIKVKTELYNEWMRFAKVDRYYHTVEFTGDSSFKFEDILFDKAVPVIFMDRDGKGVIDNPRPGEVNQWYQTNDPIEIAKKTAAYGRESKFLETLEKKQQQQ